MHARQRVERVAAQEMVCALHGPTLALVLVAPVRLALGCPREVEVEVRREPRRARSSREHDLEDVRVLVVRDPGTKTEKLGGSLRREPPLDVGRRPANRPRRLEPVEASAGVAELMLEREEVVALGLDPHQQRVKRRDVDAGRVVAALERLHERRPRAGERVEHAAAGRDVALQERLDELRDELAEVRVEPVDVLRALALGQVSLGPGELEVDAVVESCLRLCHAWDGLRGSERIS